MPEELNLKDMPLHQLYIIQRMVSDEVQRKETIIKEKQEAAMQKWWKELWD